MIIHISEAYYRSSMTSLFLRAFYEFNSLPTKVKCSKSARAFKYRLKNFIRLVLKS